MKRILLTSGFSLFAIAAQGEGIEYEIALYLQPDRTGQNTQNKSIELDEDEVTIEESGETQNRYVERDASAGEASAIGDFVATFFEGLELAPSEDVAYPHVEVQVEFQTGAMEAELTRVYPVGGVPPEVVALQRQFFEGPLFE